jgi:hypothetical protein
MRTIRTLCVLVRFAPFVRNCLITQQYHTNRTCASGTNAEMSYYNRTKRTVILVTPALSGHIMTNPDKKNRAKPPHFLKSDKS